MNPRHIVHRRIRFNLRMMAAAVALAAVLPSVARANAITLGSGQQPDVAIGSSGTAYAAWNSADDKTLYFCRLPESASSCTPTTLPVSDNASARPAVFVNGSTVQVLTNRCCSAGSRTLLFSSSDGGSTFGAPVAVGNLNPSGDAAYGPGNGISLITSALINSYYQRVPTDGSPAASAEVPLSSQYTYHAVIGIASGKPVVVFDDLNNLAWTTTNGGDPNQGSSWAAAKQIAAGHDPHLANGPGGLFLLSTNGSGSLELREFTGSGWTGPTAVQTAAGPVPGAVDSFAQGPTGGLSIVFRTTTANPTDLDFTGSTDGVHWSAPTTIATDSAIANLRVSEAPNDGTGVAVWDNGSTVSAARHPLPSAPPPPPKPPRAAFSYSPTYPMCGGQRVSLDASASTPGSAAITLYKWQLNIAWPPGVQGNLNYSFYEPESPGFSPQSIIPLTSFIAYYAEAVNGGTGYFGAWGTGEPVAEAILGSSVTLTVVDANGLTDSVTEQLPFRYASVDLAHGEAPTCYSLAEVTEPPSVALSSVALLGGNTVVVPLTCPAPTLCAGTVTLSELLGHAADASAVAAHRRHAHRRHPRTVVLGRALAVVGHGQHRAIDVKLNKLGRALARHRRLHRVLVTVTSPRHGRTRATVVSRVVRVIPAHRR